MARIAAYARKCRILRQIQSNKARRFRRINIAHNVATVVVSSFITFMGFSGIDKIHSYLNWLTVIDKLKVEFAFNLFVFFLFVLVILHLVFQFGKRQSEAERAIVSLTNMSNEIEDLLARNERGSGNVRAEDEELVRQRYNMLVGVIPPNSDREFLRARKDYQKKETEMKPIQFGPADLFIESRQKAVVESIIWSSNELVRILKVLRATDAKLYLGGGVPRNLVWDYLHGYQTPTPIDDVDVIYFDKLSAGKEHDRQFEELLKSQVPNFRWSVKNQARMHTVNNDEAYLSIQDAVSKWPETATAFVLRMTDEGQIDLIAPFGFSDLFRLIVTPTPHFTSKGERVRSRVDEKGWERTWPKIKVLGVPASLDNKPHE